VDVSSIGTVRYADSGKVVRGYVTPKGYERVNLSRNGTSVSYARHRLIAEAYVPGDTSLTVNHKDGNKRNNSIENLEWITCAENVRHAFATGLASSLGSRGSKNGRSRLTEGLVREIRKSPESSSALATRLGVSAGAIYKVRNMERWVHVT
jgi:hypothetical protein